MREGSALLQGLVTCGHCGRRLHVHYRGRNSTPGYHCAGKDLVNGRGVPVVRASACERGAPMPSDTSGSAVPLQLRSETDLRRSRGWHHELLPHNWAPSHA